MARVVKKSRFGFTTSIHQWCQSGTTHHIPLSLSLFKPRFVLLWIIIWPKTFYNTKRKDSEEEKVYRTLSRKGKATPCKVCLIACTVATTTTSTDPDTATTITDMSIPTTATASSSRKDKKTITQYFLRFAWKAKESTMLTMKDACKEGKRFRYLGWSYGFSFLFGKFCFHSYIHNDVICIYLW